MIISEDYPYIEIEVDLERFSGKIKAYVDTGFIGYLMVPIKYRDEFGWSPHIYITISLKDGSQKIVPLYPGRIRINQITRYGGIVCCGRENSWLGRRIIDECKVCFEKGKRVVVEVD